MSERFLHTGVPPERPIEQTGRALVSGVMPFLDAGKFFRESVDSVLTQTWRPLELILVDDGGTDRAALKTPTNGPDGVPRHSEAS